VIHNRPIITFLIILVLPSALTFITLLIHRVRAARAAQRDRAPEDIVKNLPWCIWTGTGWEKHEGPVPETEPDQEERTAVVNVDPEQLQPRDSFPSTSQSNSEEDQPWFEAQHECAICLSHFVKGDRVRVLPCQHIFHLDEVDQWLIHRKKLVCVIFFPDVASSYLSF
jgi:hypothetical protein